jgi:hypothetical protein
MRPIGVELKAASTLPTNDLEKQEDSSGAKSGANSVLLINLITKLVSLSESELAKLSKALTNNNPIS